MSKNEPPLGAAPADHIAAFIRMGTGAVPFVGGALSELVTQVIPGQRIQRLEAYCRYLSEEMKTLSPEQLRKKLESPEAVDLFEEGAFQSARALTDERKQQIARAVGYGLSGEDMQRLEAKRVLSLLKELDDSQIILLLSRMEKFSRDEEFRVRHAETIEPVMVHLQSSRDEIDLETVKTMALNKLEALGLLEGVFRKPKKGEMPEFDHKTGRMKQSYRRVSPAGRLLLRRIGLIDEDDF